MKGLLAKYGLNRRMAALAANTAVPGTLLGTPVVPALAADSLIFSNRVASGDIVLAANRGGNSEAGLWIDSSARETRIYGGGVLGIIVNATTVTLSVAMTPTTNDGAALGSATLSYSDLFLASGAVINFNNGDVTITHAADTLSVTGGNFQINDDVALSLGSSGDGRFVWDTTDANANLVKLQLPAGGAVNVPVVIIGQSILAVDQALYNGVVDPRVAMFGVGAVTTGPVFEFRKARGTAAAPTVVTSGDDIGTIDFYSAVANAEWVQSASIRADASGTIATTRGPGNLSFNVATDAAPSVLTERLLITGSGLVTLTAATDVAIANGTGLIVGHTAQLTPSASPEFQILGTASGADTAMLMGYYAADAGGNTIYMVKSRGATIGTNTIVQDNDNLGELAWFPADGAGITTRAADFKAEVDDASPAAGDIGVAFVWRNMPGGAGAIAETFRLTASGVVSTLGSGTPNPANVTSAGAGIFAGGIAMTDVLAAWIDDATHGAGTTTHYIGNQTITTASDMRVKDDIVDWGGEALAFFDKTPRLVDFTYNLPGGGPQDEGYGPNARGRYRGWLAQETIGWAPWIVNAGAGVKCKQCSNGLPCDNEEHPFWHVQYEHLVPMLAQGIKELSAEVKSLKKRLAAVK